MTVDLRDGVHGGFNPATDLTYQWRTAIGGKTFSVAPGATENSFYVSERGPGDPSPFWVTLPGPQRPDGSRVVLGCDCQNLGGNRIRGLNARGMAEIIVPQGHAEICSHIYAALCCPSAMAAMLQIRGAFNHADLDPMVIRAFLAQYGAPLSGAPIRIT